MLGLLVVASICSLLVIGWVIVPLVTFFRKVRRCGRALDKFPGPPKHWLYGNMKDHPGCNDEMLKWQLRHAKTYGPKAFRIWMGPIHVSLDIFHPDLVKKVLHSSEPKATSFGGIYNNLIPLIGDGLITSSGGKWFRNRRLLTPAFHFDILNTYIRVQNEAADILLEKMQLASQAGQSVEIFGPVGLCTLNIILRCACSFDDDVQRQGEEGPYIRAVKTLTQLIQERTLNVLMFHDSVFGLTSSGRKYQRNVSYVHKLAEDIIKKRREALKNLSEEELDSGKGRVQDFLDTLLLATDENGQGLTDREIRDEVDTFLVAGHDTTSSAISWILYTLACHPEDQRKCQKEVDALIQGRNGDDLIGSDMSKLPYMAMCIKEAMRIHAPVFLISREMTQDLELDGVTLPRDTIVQIQLYLLHHNEAIWGSDHQEFRPERFSSDLVEKMDPFAYIPFSAGSRNCIGQHFAMNEIKVIVSKMIHRFNLEVDRKHVVKYAPSVVMRAENGIKLYFHERPL